MRRGFTIIELLIVIAISAMLSAIAIVYSGIARNQVALSVETAKVAQTILRAKDLAIATYATGAVSCGYGVVLNSTAGTYSIFSYDPQNHPPEHGATPPCPQDTVASTSPIYADEMAQYSVDTWNVLLANGVKMDGTPGDALTVVLFYPPAPDTFISRSAAGAGGQAFLDPALGDITSKVYLVTQDGSASSTITVNGAGQVSF